MMVKCLVLPTTKRHTKGMVFAKYPSIVDRHQYDYSEQSEFSKKANFITDMEAPTGYIMPYEASSPYYPVEKCKVSLKNKSLWSQFHRLQTEMIITKSGRRMFPALHVEVADLDPQANYCVFLEMSLQSPCRYKYSSSVGWTPAGNEEAQSPNRLYMHPQSPSTGEHWMSQTVSFSRLKLTNTSVPPQGHLVLSSMHRYQPRILIVQTSNPTSLGWSPSKVAIFPETQFIAVTAYQNEKITKLKIDHNPFAKGFRENGKSSTNKRKHSEIDEINVVDNDEDLVKPIKKRFDDDDGEIIVKKDPITRLHQVEGEPLMYKSRMMQQLAPSPLYGYPCYPHPYPFYNPQIWAPQHHYPVYYQYPVQHQAILHQPHYYEQQYQSQPQDLSTSNEESQPDDQDKDPKKKPAKKVTDFSIRKITGFY